MKPGTGPRIIKELRAVIIDKKRLRKNGSWNKGLEEVLLDLVQQKKAVLEVDLQELEETNKIPERKSGFLELLKEQDLYPEQCLVIADCGEMLEWAKLHGMAVLGYESGGQGLLPFGQEMIVEGFEEVDFDFLNRVYLRFHRLPWTVIETSRCLLREMTLEDLDALYEIYGDKKITRYMEGLYGERKKEEEYTKAYIEAMYRFYGYGMWVVIEKDSKRLIGRAGLSNREFSEGICLELGYVICSAYQRRGLATEVCSAILNFAEESLDFEAVYCLIERENRISLHLAEKLGFQRMEEIICEGKAMERYRKTLHF